MSPPAVRASELAYAYPDGRRAIDGVSLDLAPRDSLGIIGPNGAGKTTLVHLLAGLERPARGHVEIFGKRFDGGADPDLRRRIGIVFQESQDQLFSPTVFDDVAFGPLHFGLDERSIPSRVEDALRQVGLEGYGSRVPHQLSCGERRRAALASVLSYAPDVLVLDEPTSDLDARGRRELLRLLGSLDQALVIASHDLSFVLYSCRRVLVLDGGSVCAEGLATEILADHELLEAHGLEAPLGLRDLDRESLERLLEREHPQPRGATTGGVP